MAKTSKAFSTEEALRFGWKTTKENYFIFIALFVIQVFFFITRIIVNAQIPKHNNGMIFIVSFIFYLISAAITFGTLHILLLLVKGKKTQITDIFSVLSYSPYYIIGQIIETCITIIGCILLIIPGIIWGLQFGFFGYVMLDKKTGPIDALKKSAEITKGNIWKLFGFSATMLIINILGALCLLIGLFITIPMTMISTAYVYKKLSSK